MSNVAASAASFAGSKSSSSDSGGEVSKKGGSNNNNNKNSLNIFKNIKKCRTCLSTNRDTVPLKFNVPDAIEERATYYDYLRQCVGKDLPTANLCGSYTYPMQICLRCCKALEVTTHFVRMAKESERKLALEANKIAVRGKVLQQQTQQHEVELKRKAVKPVEEQYSQQFTRFVQSYEPLIEENVLYMRGTKVPRVEPPTANANAKTNESDIILFDVVYDNTVDEDNENDVSDTRNNETFFDESSLPEDVDVDGGSSTMENNALCVKNERKNNNNNNISILNSVVVESNNIQQANTTNNNNNDIIQKALFLALNDNSSNTGNGKESADERISNIKADLLKSVENFKITEIKRTSTTTLNPSTYLRPEISCDLCNFTTSDQECLNTHYQREHKRKEEDLHEAGVANSGNSNDVGGGGGAAAAGTISPTFNERVTITFKCRSCKDYNSQIKTEMCQHLAEHHKVEKNYELFYVEQQHCPDCERVFKDLRSLRTHYTRIHGCSKRTTTNESFICDICTKSYNSKASLHSHQRFCKTSEPVSCSFCLKKFNTVRYYELHLQNEHAVSTVHECEVCSKVFKTADALAIHRKRHTERYFQCAECSSNYINANELKVHYERTHVRHEKVNCGCCGQEFQNRSLLREHEQRSHQNKLLSCENCDFETTTRTRLRQHQYEHTGYPYKCNVCQEEFDERWKIRQHSKKLHSIELTDDQLAEMFRERLGYTSRQDAFSKANNSLEISGISDECYTELKELNINYDDMISDLFTNNNVFDNLLDYIP